MDERFGNEIVIRSEERDTIQGTAGEVIGDFAPEFPTQHRVHIVMRGVGEVGLGVRGHFVDGFRIGLFVMLEE